MARRITSSQQKINLTTASDQMLLELTRDGIPDAFGELWSRHSGSVVAATRASTGYDPNDLMQEAFLKVYSSIQAGGELPISFRAYVATTARRLAVDQSRKDAGAVLNSFEEDCDASSLVDADFSERVLDDSTTGQAFRALASRHREALWYRDVEDLPVQEVARYLGMTPNATTVLIKRARDAFKTAWIKVQLSPQRNLSEECASVVPRLAAFSRGKLGATETGVIELHLLECVHCAALATEADELHKKLALVLLPMLLLSGAPGYLVWIQRRENRTPVPTVSTYANVTLNGVRRMPVGLRGLQTVKGQRKSLVVAAVVASILVAGSGAVAAIRFAETGTTPVAPTREGPATTGASGDTVPSEDAEPVLSGEPRDAADSSSGAGVSQSMPETVGGELPKNIAAPEQSTSGGSPIAPGTPAAPPMSNPEPAPTPVTYPEPRELHKYPTESPYTIRFTATVGARVTLDITAPGHSPLTVVRIADLDGNVFYDFPEHRGATVRVTITQEWESATGPQIDQLPGVLWDHPVPA